METMTHGAEIMKKIVFPILLALLLMGLLTLPACSAQNKPSSTATTTIQTTVTTISSIPSAIGTVDDLESTLESIYERTNPSLVNIDVIVQGTVFSPSGEALGTGFIWDKQGNIVTNNHVIDGATSVTVSFSDGTAVDATIVGTDVDSDLAVIKVSADSSLLQPVTMGDSTKLKVGQLAIAIGEPFGLQGSMTLGIISSLGRLLPVDNTAIGPSYSIPDVIQTDAAINPGNSGGVLLDKDGNVIGVTQSIASNSGSSSGVGFAIPSAIVQKVVPMLIQTGHYSHPYLGISVGSLTPVIAQAMNLPANQRGALVATVVAGGPADLAGLLASTTPVTVNGLQTTVGGDVIIAFNGQTVKTSDDLIAYLARSGVVGQNITLTVLRNGQRTTVTVMLGARPSS